MYPDSFAVLRSNWGDVEEPIRKWKNQYKNKAEQNEKYGCNTWQDKS